ncbi:MAG: nicotinate-nucleotide--dimethylbenzimidazole phosphoribosyltransferase [Candidatus Omnitrophica bacterium]|nr:nicotinate-nucleotide--dimethylbenzimidazole phosphoribosyltransferase [Candidatus Omnitrophota bacterium]MBU4488380.1 nicotinate-nucleotide--dimethylbenzimidazole phosphoribosyltransferase [Candidatus Omnitrophota bacterium]
MEKIKKIVDRISELDADCMNKTQERLNNLTKPLGSLGRLEEIARLIAGITGKNTSKLRHKVIFTLAADHGITEEGVSAYPKEVTAQMVYNFINGGAGINVLARHVGARVIVVDMGVAEKLTTHDSRLANFKDRKIAFGTKNFLKGRAMTRDEAIKSVETGIEIFEEEKAGGADIIGIGEMGIGNTTAASAISACLTRRGAKDVTGRGTGIGDEALGKKIDVIEKALKINKPDPNDPLDVLSKVGGFEIGGLVGIVLASASHRTPVVMDGFISTAAALIAYTIEPKIKGYLIASHSSVEKGHRVILDYMGLKPILNLDLRLGEGTGAALGISIVEASVRILNEMATFKSANVSERSK